MIAYRRQTVHVYILPCSDDRGHVALHHLHDAPQAITLGLHSV